MAVLVLVGAVWVLVGWVPIVALSISARVGQVLSDDRERRLVLSVALTFACVWSAMNVSAMFVAWREALA